MSSVTVCCLLFFVVLDVSSSGRVDRGQGDTRVVFEVSREVSESALCLSSDDLCFHGRSNERIRISGLEQVNHSSVLQLQTPLCRLKLHILSALSSSPYPLSSTHNAHPRLPMTLEPHLSLLSRSLNPIHHINLPMQLINLSTDIRNFTRKIHLVSQNFSRDGVGA